jgi:hypothetical protein
MTDGFDRKLPLDDLWKKGPDKWMSKTNAKSSSKAIQRLTHASGKCTVATIEGFRTVNRHRSSREPVSR